MKIVIASPSAGRASTCIAHKHFPSLSYVVDESEAKAYRKRHQKVIAVPPGIQGSYPRVCNWILDNCGDRVLILDDDVSGIVRWDHCYLRKLGREETVEFIEHGFSLAEQMGVHYWGINIVTDKGAYREYTPFCLRAYLGGPFQAHLQNECRYDEAMLLKEDYDMTLQVLNRYRMNLRFNMYSFVAKQHTNTGGCAAYRTINREQEAFEALLRKWGSRIVRRDTGASRTRKRRQGYDINPIIKVPIAGV